MNFKELDVRQLDKNLSTEQQKEWNSIYASYRSQSFLTGKVAGIDEVMVKVWDPEIQKNKLITCECLIIVDYRVKVLIPESEIWAEEEARPSHVLHSMIGATVDYVITQIDRVGEVCVASRRIAMAIKRRSFTRLIPRIGSKIDANVIAVGKTKLLASTNGYDVSLSQRDLSYAMIIDLRDRYHAGDVYSAVLKSWDQETDTIEISIKEAEPHPFIGCDMRHPMGSRRASQIVGKYKGGVFCTLEDNLVCMCTYSHYQSDEDFNIGDNVIIVITKYNYEKMQVYGKIMAKW